MQPFNLINLTLLNEEFEKNPIHLQHAISNQYCSEKVKGDL